MRELPIRRIPGIGRVMERILTSMGIDVRARSLLHRETADQPRLVAEMRRHLHSSGHDQRDGSLPRSAVPFVSATTPTKQYTRR